MMAERDRLERVEYQLATVARQIAGMPVRIARTSGRSGSNLATMLVLTENISAATGDTSSITPADALAQKYATDSVTGERTPTDEDPITIYNYDTCQSYSSGTQVWVSNVDGNFPEIISAACCQLSEPA